MCVVQSVHCSRVDDCGVEGVQFSGRRVEVRDLAGDRGSVLPSLDRTTASSQHLPAERHRHETRDVETDWPLFRTKYRRPQRQGSPILIIS